MLMLISNGELTIIFKLNEILQNMIINVYLNYEIVIPSFELDLQNAWSNEHCQSHKQQFTDSLIQSKINEEIFLGTCNFAAFEWLWTSIIIEFNVNTKCIIIILSNINRNQKSYN